MQAIERQDNLNLDQLSFRRWWSDQPFYAPPHFDIEKLMDIAKGRAAEAQDELWLLQTDTRYFHMLLESYVERIKCQYKAFQVPKPDTYKLAAISVTPTVVLAARNWQWVLDECEHVKQEMVKSTHSASHRKALCSLKALLKCVDVDSRDYLKLVLLMTGTSFDHMCSGPQI